MNQEQWKPAQTPWTAALLALYAEAVQQGWTGTQKACEAVLRREAHE